MHDIAAGMAYLHCETARESNEPGWLRCFRSHSNSNTLTPPGTVWMHGETAVAAAGWAGGREVLLHRQLKPSNVLLTGGYRAKLTGLGTRAAGLRDSVKIFPPAPLPPPSFPPLTPPHTHRLPSQTSVPHIHMHARAHYISYKCDGDEASSSPRLHFPVRLTAGLCSLDRPRDVHRVRDWSRCSQRQPNASPTPTQRQPNASPTPAQRQPKF